MSLQTALQRWLAPEIDDELSGNVHRTIHAGIFVMVVFVIGFLVWAGLAPLASAVMANGVIKVEGNRQLVQHPSGGIIKTIHVRNGERVAAGQLLVALGDERASATFDLMQSMQDGELVRNARLQAEQNFSKQIVLPPQIEKKRQEPNVARLIHGEESLFNTRRQAYHTQQKILTEQEDQSAQQILSYQQQVKSVIEAIRLMQDERDANKEMVEKGYVSKARWLSMERSLSEYDAHLNELRGKIALTRQQLNEIGLRRSALQGQYMQTAATELKDSNQKLLELAEQIRPSEDASVRLQLRAPTSGVVVNLKPTTIGEIIRPGETILEIVPDHLPLIIDSQIGVNDVNHVHIGTPVKIRLSAFNARTTPELDGMVTYVSADRLDDPATRLPFYAVRIKLNDGSLHAAGDPAIVAGMQVSLFMKSGERTLLDYLLQPIKDSVSRGMHEN